MWKFLYATFKPLYRVYTWVWPLKPRTSGCVHNPNNFGVFLDMDPTHLNPSLPMPWDRSDSTFHYPFEKLYKELYDTLKAYERIESKETIVHCCRYLCLTLHPFVPWRTFVFFPSFPFACELAIERWRIEVVEAQVGDLVSPVRRCAIRGCIYCNLWFKLIEISFFVQ